ncbi:hypothetical protein F66182_5264 [Fusarium sp. NRRL 66182]|nr:hypothetical protein F66182_5264 [Fusarium sp. NRRL 66182]
MEDTASRVKLVGNTNSTTPLILCFHGSGDSCASWASLSDLLSDSYQVLLYDRQGPDMKPDMATHKMLSDLDEAHLHPPYMLVAHSYGGTFARLFLEQRPQHVAGMVLVETGQETAIDADVEQQQYKRQILGHKPLVVIRGNTLIHKWEQYQETLAAENNIATPSLLVQKQLLDATDREDERLKKAQLQLSRNHRYIHIPDCGHGVIQARPDVVAEAICWAMENQQTKNEKETARKGLGLWLREIGDTSFVRDIARCLGKSGS